MAENLLYRFQSLAAKLRADKEKAIAANEEKRKAVKIQRATNSKINAEKRKASKTSPPPIERKRARTQLTDQRHAELVPSNSNTQVTVTVTVNNQQDLVEATSSNTRTKKHKSTIKKGKKQKVTTTQLDIQRKRVRERVQKHRAKLSDESLSKRREKDRLYRRARKEKKLDKTIGEMSEREKRRERKKWCAYSKAYRDRKAASTLTAETQESTDIADEVEECSSTRKSTRKKNSSGRSKLLVKLQNVEEELKKEKKKNRKVTRRLERYKKRLQRSSISNVSSVVSPSPATKVKQLTAGRKIPEDICKRLVFGEIVTRELQKKKGQGKKERQVIQKIMSSNMLKNYKMIGQAEAIVNYRQFKRMIDSKGTCVSYDKRVMPSVIIREARKVREFLEDDQNSRMCPSKRVTSRMNCSTFSIMCMHTVHFVCANQVW